MGVDEKASLDHPTGNDRKGFVWPRLFLSLSSKEKEEDFMAMKGCKLPQRPKKRAKLLQKSLVVSVLSLILQGGKGSNPSANPGTVSVRLKSANSSLVCGCSW